MKKKKSSFGFHEKTVDFAKKESHCTFLCLPSLLLLKTTMSYFGRKTLEFSMIDRILQPKIRNLLL